MSLNHPNLGAIYHFERGASLQALVLELVEGQTLHERLRAGPIPAGEVVTIARQIVEALCAAHDKGIVHRDLKPANIKVTPDRIVKCSTSGWRRRSAWRRSASARRTTAGRAPRTRSRRCRNSHPRRGW